jgi:outer membrane receptor for ferrienterochelin and colicins
MYYKLFIFLLLSSSLKAQNGNIYGTITNDSLPVEMAEVILKDLNKITLTDANGNFSFADLPYGHYNLIVRHPEFLQYHNRVQITSAKNSPVQISLRKKEVEIGEVVITGTMKEVTKMESTVPVEVYSPTFFKKNPTPSIYDALQNVNGVRPQLNCNICNTGDIHINGLEGPYTMILIDGMPIVSSLSTVYGLSGIPNSLVERMEIVKGPASSLYGSEAIGGIINIITKKPSSAPLLSVDLFSTSWLETNVDIGLKANIGKKITSLTGINYFNYSTPLDNNNDNFTDVTLAERISIFNKLSIDRKENRIFTIAARYYNEERWGGEMQWEEKFRGGDSVYGESIYTERWELLTNYQLPVKEKIMFSTSFNMHDQDSRYGTTSYIANQKIAFGQLLWDKKFKRNDFLLGTSLRYTAYDDNTPGTSNIVGNDTVNMESHIFLPGVFFQNEFSVTENQKLLLGFRYDYNSVHGNIYTPRLGYKWDFNSKTVLRANVGTGYRIVNLFTEDHAALTGARKIEIVSELNPEKSYNANLNFTKRFYTKKKIIWGLDATAFYTYFNNRIIADYETDVNKIIYANLDGYAVSQGISLNFDIKLPSGLKVIAGGTFMDVATIENGEHVQQILSEKFTGTWSVSYPLHRIKMDIDYTGNVYSPMRLPLLGELDPRAQYSPWWSLQNIQITYKGLKSWEFYGGVKNLLNWTPNKGTPFMIARANDPFDKNVAFDANGNVLATPDNPYALTFDPAYVYGPNQGIRGFLGIRYKFK